MKILLVGPGIMPIPTTGWGAVEIVVWQQKTYLERSGHTVDILNTRGWRAALKTKPRQYDVVHLHYDELAGFWVRLARGLHFPLVITTHYGYADNPERWEPGYHRVFAQLLKAPALLVLSPQIAATFRERGFKGWIGVLPNGTESEQIRFSAYGNGKALCLGKIEKRKKQALLANLLNNARNVCCDFVGPLVAKDFYPDDTYTRYLGTWTRSEVHTNLTDYSCLVLASEGEAHPLVVLEAFAAGLSVVLTREASANLDLSKPWIKVLDTCDTSFVEAVAQACRENVNYRDEIRKYAVTMFDWSSILAKYPQIIQQAMDAQ